MDAKTILAIMPAAGARAAEFAVPLSDAMERYAITTRLRQAAFLAQLAHESGSMQHVRERWGPTPAQLRYEGRKDLGNTQPGDGKRFLGRGLIQVTGRLNYAACGAGLGIDCVAKPDLLEQPEYAALSAGWYWNSRGINAPADAGDFERVTRLVNGGLNGYAERKAFYARALQALRPDFSNVQSGAETSP